MVSTNQPPTDVTAGFGPIPSREHILAAVYVQHAHSLPPTLVRAAIHWSRASFARTWFSCHHQTIVFKEADVSDTSAWSSISSGEKLFNFDIMSEFEPIPEENPRQSGSRSTQKEGGSSDRKSKSGDKHAGREKKARSSKTRSSKGESSSSGQAGQVHGRSGSNSSSKSAKKSEPLISLTSTVDVDMVIAETNSVHGIVPFYFSFVCPLILALIVVWTCKMENVTMLNSLSACSLLLLLQCPCSLSVLRSSAFFSPSKSFIVPLFQIFGFTWIYGVKCWVYFQRISASPSRGTVSSKCRSSMTQCQPFDRVDANLECLVNRKSARANACFSF